MNTSKTYLKIKIKSLAAEAKIIKHEERKWKAVPWNGPDNPHHPRFWGLKHHRIEEVRTECRAAHVAYGYLRGRTYAQIEAKCHTEPNWEKISILVLKYGANKDRTEVWEAIKVWRKRPSTEKEVVEEFIENRPRL